ncbi:MAG: glutamine synthetase family protein [Actinomycetota bacterium]|nr:glutamine synthetase family protein [Actinomycetota bacterium]
MTLVDAGKRVADPSLLADVREQLEQAGVRLLMMTMVDNAGVTRVKLAPLRRLEAVARSGVGMSSLWAVSGSDDLFAYVPPFDTPSGDMRLVPDLTAVRVLPSSPGYAWAPVSQCDEEIRIEPICQRSLLQRVVAQGQERGIEFRTTFETEMTLLRADGEPVHHGPGYSAQALLPLEGFAVELADALEAAGIEVDQVHPEYAPGQFEVSVAAQDPLRAADEQVLLRIIARQVARNHDLSVSFAPVVVAGAAGNGSHFHLSAWRDDENLMQGGSGAAGMQPDAAAIVAGVLESLPNLVAILVPSAPGYWRLQPHHWAGAYACWGIENREAGMRFIPGSASTRARSANVEVKVLDGAANPYLASASILACGLHGLELRRSLSPPVQEDPGELSDAELTARGIVRLPRDLGEASVRLKGDEFLRVALGEILHGAVVAVCNREWSLAADHPPEALAPSYRFRF